jgi:hypothetical protein
MLPKLVDEFLAVANARTRIRRTWRGVFPISSTIYQEAALEHTLQAIAILIGIEGAVT